MTHPPEVHETAAYPLPPGPADSAVLTCVLSSQVQPGDRQALLDLFDRSSLDTRLRRFHHALSVFPRRYLDDILTGRQLAVVARDVCHPDSYGKVFGLASAAPTGSGEAEFAVWVDDAWQGRGLGTLLVRAILRALTQAGTAVAIGFIQADNVPVQRLIRRVAPEASFRAEDGIVIVRIPLAGARAWHG
jgi:GNAT superfamily N-acetyltransferase